MPEKKPPKVEDVVAAALAASQDAVARSLAYARQLTPPAASVPTADVPLPPASEESQALRARLVEQSEALVARLRAQEARIAERYDAVARGVVARAVALLGKKPG